MAEQDGSLKITAVEVAKELPDYKGKGAKVFRYTVEGDERQPEDFVMNDREPKKVGDVLPGIENSEYGPKVKREARGAGGGGGFKRSPAETKAIQRQHSQEMGLRREANLIAAGQPAFSDDELRTTIDWFEADISGKIVPGVQRGPMTSDVPFDTFGLEEVGGSE